MFEPSKFPDDANVTFAHVDGSHDLSASDPGTKGIVDTTQGASRGSREPTCQMFVSFGFMKCRATHRGDHAIHIIYKDSLLNLQTYPGHA